VRPCSVGGGRLAGAACLTETAEKCVAAKNEDVARIEHYVSISEGDRETATDDQEEVISFIMLVPDERALDLDDLQLVIIELADNPRHVGLVQQREVLSQIDLVVDRL
jgi:hypothetical protein